MAAAFVWRYASLEVLWLPAYVLQEATVPTRESCTEDVSKR